MKLMSMVALQPFAFEGRSYVQGECFEVRPVVAAALTRARSARFAEAKDMQPEQRAVMTAEAPSMNAPKTRRARKTGGERRQYHRKDISTTV